MPLTAYKEHLTSAFIKEQLSLLGIPFITVPKSVTGLYADIGESYGVFVSHPCLCLEGFIFSSVTASINTWDVAKWLMTKQLGIVWGTGG